MKEGQTIKINFGKKTASGASASQSSVSRGVHAHAPPGKMAGNQWFARQYSQTDMPYAPSVSMTLPLEAAVRAFPNPIRKATYVRCQAVMALV
jgi:hypothetical protein